MPLSQDDDQLSDVARVSRERVGAAVHRLIEQLSAVRLTLRGVEGALNGGRLALRLRESIAELDDATEQLRGAVRPQQPPSTTSGGTGLAARLLEVVIKASASPDSPPGLHFSGMDVALPEDVEADLRAVLHQALAHVKTRTTTDVEVRVAATADRLTAQITEYGTAVGPVDRDAPDSHAEDDGGAFSGGREQSGTRVTQSGTRLTWTVPLGVSHAVHGRPPTAGVPAPRRAAGNGDASRT
jgi:hypothetical protein